MKAKAVYCQFHCAACDGHFTSLEAFDAHRRGSHDKNTRHCIDPARITKGVHRLFGVRGVCRVSEGVHRPRPGVMVWQIARGLDLGDMREPRFQAVGGLRLWDGES